MANGINRVVLLGSLGADPELRVTQSGVAVLNLRLATNESYLDKDKVRRERTDWHSVKPSVSGSITSRMHRLISSRWRSNSAMKLAPSWASSTSYWFFSR